MGTRIAIPEEISSNTRTFSLKVDVPSQMFQTEYNVAYGSVAK
jgi:hypothetical protein